MIQNDDNYMREAVRKVFEYKKNNNWPISFCVGRVSKDYKLDFSTLMSACGIQRGRKEVAPIVTEKKEIKQYYNKRLEERKTPWWIRD
jgi:hypothetical protein